MNRRCHYLKHSKPDKDLYLDVVQLIVWRRLTVRKFKLFWFRIQHSYGVIAEKKMRLVEFEDIFGFVHFFIVSPYQFVIIVSRTTCPSLSLGHSPTTLSVSLFLIFTLIFHKHLLPLSGSSLYLGH